jgi:hypothetical protein
LQVGDSDRAVPVIGDDEEDWQETMFGEIYGEDFRFGRSVVGIGGDSDFIGGVVVMERVGFSGLGEGFDELFVFTSGGE